MMPTGPNVRCSIVVTTWKRASLLRATLDSLALQSEKSVEVIVVSDGEDAETRELTESYRPEFPLTWLYNAQNEGLPASRNRGASAAQGEVLLFLDDDSPGVPDLIHSHMAHHLGASPTTRLIVRGRIEEVPAAIPRSFTGVRMQHAWERTLADDIQQDTNSAGHEFERASCFGLNCSIRRAQFAQTRGFDARLRYMDEEMEFGHRLYMSGFQVVHEPHAVVHHRNTKDIASYFERCWYLGGQDDVLRVREMAQRNAQTSALLGMDVGPWITKSANRMAWHASSLLNLGAGILRKIADRANYRVAFGAWARARRSAQYWSAVRERMTRQEVADLAGAPKRVLMLHSISVPETPEEATYYLSPRRFRTLLQWLKTAGYNSADSMGLLAGDTGLRDFVLTFDDGYDDFYTEVFPLIHDFKLKPIVFLPVDRIGQANLWDQANGLRARKLMTLSQILELRRHGVRFGSHTLTHPSLPRLSEAELRREVFDSKRKLEDLLSEEVSMFAYPFGELDRRARAAVLEAGYKMAFSTTPGLNYWQDQLLMNRAGIDETDSLLNMVLKPATGMGASQLLKHQIRPLFDCLPQESAQRILKWFRGEVSG